MSKRLLAIMASLAVAIASLAAAPAYSDTPKAAYQKMPSSAKTTLRKKSGYWVECSYSGLGDVCTYVYARPRAAKGLAPIAGAKLQRVKVSTKSALKRRAGYWVECQYSGLGQVCDYVYMTPRKPKP